MSVPLEFALLHSRQQEEEVKERYPIFAVGDINDFFGLMLDNM